MKRFGILFLHHHRSAVVLNNLRSVKRNNPNATVVTISAGIPLPGGYSLDRTPALKKQHSLNVERSSDCLVCSWFTQRQEICDKWWIIEWDTYCEISARDYYRPVWSFPFVASIIHRPDRDPNWPWFSGIKDMRNEYKGYAMGALPFLYLLSDPALTATCRTLLAAPLTAGNGELRFATAANKCGFPPYAYSPPNNQISWKNHPSLVKPRTIAHPIKFYAYPKWRFDVALFLNGVVILRRLCSIFRHLSGRVSGSPDRILGTKP
jgi:hypothetical protein